MPANRLWNCCIDRGVVEACCHVWQAMLGEGLWVSGTVNLGGPVLRKLVEARCASSTDLAKGNDLVNVDELIRDYT